MLVLDGASALDIEEAKRDFIFGIRLNKEVLESAPVLKTDLASIFSVCDTEEDRILFSFYLVLSKACASAHGRPDFVVRKLSTHIIFTRRSNRIDKLLLSHIQLP